MKHLSDRSKLAQRRLSLSAEKQAELERRMRGEKGSGAQATTLRADASVAPLSFGQERLLFLEELNSETAAFNENALLRLRGDLDVLALEACFQLLARRHEMLRAAFVRDAGAVQQRIAPEVSLAFEHVDLRDFGEAERTSELERRATQEVQRPFDLARAPLLRLFLFRLDAHEHALLLVNHHLISDGWSRAVMLRELSVLYEWALGEKQQASASLEPWPLSLKTRPLPLPPLALHYGDYATRLRGEEQQRHAPSLSYFRQALAGIAPLELPTDRTRPPVQSFHGSVFEFELDREVCQQVSRTARAEGTTPFVTLLAAFGVLLGRLSGQSDLVVGSPFANRGSVDTEALVGFLVNSVPLRVDLAGAPSFRELLSRLRRTVGEALSHAHVPFERVVDALEVPRDPSRSPVFQVFFALQNLPEHELRLRGVEVHVGQVRAPSSRFDLTLELVPTGDRLHGRFEYNSRLFDESTIARIAERYCTLLASAVSEPSTQIEHLQVMSAAERSLVLDTWNDSEVALGDAHHVARAFETQVARTPHARALVGDSATLTFTELNVQANRLAHELIAHGVGPEVRVAVCMEHGVGLVIALLAVLKAGGAYVPLDPAYPHDRLSFIVQDAGAALVLTSPRSRAAVPSVDVPSLLYDANAPVAESPLGAVPRSTENPSVDVSQEHAAYLIYTSGSTGKPKGVVVQHGNVLNLFAALDAVLGPERGTWLALTSFAFDISVLELFWTLSRGFCVVVPTDAETQADERSALPAPQRAPEFSLFFFAANESQGGSHKYKLLLDAARFADTHDFTAIWTPERHFHAFGGLYPNPSVTSAALAAITERVKIRAGSVVLPLHDPIRVAEEWSVVDNISQGRVGISFAAGWHADDFVLRKDGYQQRRDMLLDKLDVFRRLWRGESVELENGLGKTVAVQTLPRPAQSEPPLWLTSSGDPRTFQLAAAQKTSVLTHLLGQTVDDLAAKIELYRREWREQGHEGRGHVTLMLHTFVGEDLEQVRSIVREPFRNYLRTSVDLIEHLARGMGFDATSGNFDQADLEALLDHAFERYFAGASLMGTVDSCARLVERLSAIGVDEIACLVDFGIAQELVLASLPHLDALRMRSKRPSANKATLDLPALLARHSVTHFQCTPSAAVMLREGLPRGADESRAALPLTTLLVGGEPLTPELSEELCARVPAVYNMYGPTETTVWSSAYRCQPSESRVPIGTPLANTRFYVLDAALQPVPIGVMGELYIGGLGVARGYHARPELSAERFQPDPFSKQPGARMYRTGDLVSYRADGVVEFRGRNDSQVKLRGFRIELGEIEAVLAKHPSIRESVVVVHGEGNDRRLVAYVVGRWGKAATTTELRAFLKDKLPQYMVPALFMAVEALPKLPNGKIDRKALPAPVATEPRARSSVVTPRTDVEAKLVALWADLLKLESVSVDDDFFELGGHSLLAAQLVARVREVFGSAVTLRAFMEAPTVSAMARRIEAHTNP